VTKRLESAVQTCSLKNDRLAFQTALRHLYCEAAAVA
jgi:hypothetical protein